MRGRVMAHVETCRPYTTAYPGLVGLAGAASAVSATSALPVHRWIVAWLAPTLVWIGAHYIGDYFDRRLDALSKPHRPIPSGRLSESTAIVVGTGCALLAAAVTVAVNWRALVVVLVAASGVVVYSRVAKARGLSGNLVRGMLTSLAFVFGAMTARDWPALAVVPWALVFCLQDTASNLVGALRDVEGDAAGGYRTLPVTAGVRVASWTATALFGLAVAVASMARLAPAPTRPNLALLLAALLLGVLAYTLLLEGKATTATALRAHEVLVVQRLLSAAALCCAGMGIGATLAVLVPSLALTVWSQGALRRRHEFGIEESSVMSGA